MKKILTTILTSALLICAPATVFAETPEMEALDKNATSGSIELVAEHASEYYVKLPKKLDISDTSTTFNIFAKGDVDGSKMIVFEEGKNDGKDNYLKDDAQLKADKKLTVTSAGGIKASDLNANEYDETKGTTMTIVHDAIEAGKWSGTLPIIIRLADAD